MSSSKAVAGLILTLTGLVAGSVGLIYSTGSSDSSSHDVQPVSFSHARHAGELRIDCLYCHRSAAVSAIADVPSLQLCLGCHRNLVSETTETLKLSAYWEKQESIAWIRLHRLPDFVHFTHELHLRAGLPCITCHGRVAEMATTPRAPSYEMGWCVSCHQEREASLDCWSCHK
jgi:Cytochrome c7 and related cytochrome c/Class III cytochrome C family